MIALVCGLPNSGKTTYSKRYRQVVHRDDCPYPQHITFPQAVAKIAGDVCGEGVYNTRKERISFLDAMTKRDDLRICIFLDTPVEICLQRENNGRRRGEYLVMRGAERMELPTLDEGWDEIIIIRGEDEKHISRQM